MIQHERGPETTKNQQQSPAPRLVHVASLKFFHDLQEVGIYNDSKVMVRRLICLQGDAPNLLDTEKFTLELRKALAEPGGARGWKIFLGGSMKKSLRNLVS